MQCFNCKGKDIVLDYTHGDYICRICGVINDKKLFIENIQHQAHSFSHTSSNNQLNGNFVSMNVHNIASSEYVRAIASGQLYKGESSSTFLAKLENRTKTLVCFAELLDVNESILNFATVSLKNNKSLLIRKPTKETLYALLIASAREKGHFINTQYVADTFLLKSLGKHVIAIAKILKLSQKSDPILEVHRYVQLLGFPYIYGKHIKQLYEKAQRHSKMSCETLLGAILYQVWLNNKQDSSKKDVTPDYVAQIVNLKDSSKIEKLF